MFFIEKKNNDFSEFELIANPKIIKKIKKMDDDELLRFIENSILKNEVVKIKEILNNISSTRKNMIQNFLKTSTILTKRNNLFLFSDNISFELYSRSNSYAKEINKNTDW